MVNGNSPAPRRRVSVGIWLAICSFLVAAMVLLGGATRLTDSGLSIVDWKPLTGWIPPLTDAAWQKLFDAYKQTSEFQKQNFWMTATDFRSIYWLEYLHRVLGRVIGIVFFLPFLWFLIRGQLGGGLWWRCLLVFLLGGAQGYLGWYMVQSGLVDRTDVSQYRLAAHLSLAVIIYMALLWLTLRCLRPRPTGGRKRLGFHTGFLVLLVFLTMAAGAFVAGIDAGLAYNSFPLMDGRYIPQGWLQMSPVWLNFFENTATVQFVHRQLGLLVVAIALLLWLRSRWAGPGRAACRAIDLTFAFAILQMCLGIATLLAEVPILFGILHQAGAMCVLTFALWSLYELAAIDGRRANRTAPRM